MSFFSHNYVKNLTEPCHNDIILLVDVTMIIVGSLITKHHTTINQIAIDYTSRD
jgi:hypothetical protein